MREGNHQHLHPPAPSPSQLVGKDPTNGRPEADSQTKDTEDNANYHRPLLQGDCQCDDSKRPLVEAGGPEPLDRPAKDEDGARRSRCRKDRADCQERSKSARFSGRGLGTSTEGVS